MKIGFVVDGRAEYHSLKLLLPKIDSPYTLLNPLYADMQPFAPPAQIARVALKRVSIFEQKGADGVVVLLDKEKRGDCTIALWRKLRRAVRQKLDTSPISMDVRVVLKVMCYENWLIADPDALRAVPGLLSHIERIERAVAPNKADHVDALHLLNRCTPRGRFNKVAGAKAICNHLDPDRAAHNSRSFRRFLRVLQHTSYRLRTDSKHP